MLALPSCLPAQSLVDHSSSLPSWQEFLRVVILRDYNTRVVVIGTTLLGAGAGLIGTYLLLRKRSLLSDAVAHSTLPGIALAFIIATKLGMDGKNLATLLTGAAVFGSLGMGSVLVITKYSRLKDDAALGIVLSVFFGLGVSLLAMATKIESGNAAGLNNFIYGKTASMLYNDALLIGVCSLVILVLCALLSKEFALLCFDSGFATSVGYRVGLLDTGMMLLAVLITVIGLQAVGLILIVALLVIPPAAARFWSHRLGHVLAWSAGIGALSGLLGSALSALMPNLPAGAVIVLVAAAIFAVSLLFGPARGVARHWWEQRRLAHRVALQHLLRALYETAEQAGLARAPEQAPLSIDELARARSWSRHSLTRLLARAERLGLVAPRPDGSITLTPGGARQARRISRNHRLWGLYLITHADIAPSHVDRDADQIEHILDDDMIERLERLMEQPGATQERPA